MKEAERRKAQIEWAAPHEQMSPTVRATGAARAYDEQHSKRLYRQRNCIERVLGHLKINRAIATRYDQLAESFLGMLFIASARYWIKFVHAA
jgi:transposase